MVTGRGLHIVERSGSGLATMACDSLMDTGRVAIGAPTVIIATIGTEIVTIADNYGVGPGEECFPQGPAPDATNSRFDRWNSLELN